MTRPDVEDILKPLKSFQHRTVDHAFHRLFMAQDGTARFLVADEVGLGKTLVARGVIARAIDHLWDDVGRIDIIYICSNGSIARANLPKLQIGAGTERSLALATRLTMLATEFAPRDGAATLADAKLNFVSFTPGTSFNMGHSSGQAGERQILFQLLEPFVRSRTALMNLLQCDIRNKDDWRSRLNNWPVPLEANIKHRFRTEFEDSQLATRLYGLLEAWFRRYRAEWPAEARRQRNALIADLRRLLAETCVQALEPDLVILDEFQRFKPLLETQEGRQEPGAALAQALFKSRTPEGNPVRTLLLSATPYKLYTADAEIEHEDHYEDFLATTRFLLDGDEDRVRDVQRRLATFATVLKRAAASRSDQAETIVAAKREVEAALRAIMARTERVPASDDRDAMVEEHKRAGKLTPAEVRQYVASDALFRAVGDGDPIRFWKSAPYLAHFMHGYKFNERLDETITLSPDKVMKVLARHESAFLKDEEIRSWMKLDPANTKLQHMVSDLLDEGLWRLLWIPPTLPYWPLGGPFKGKGIFTKTLLFSAWNVVPDVVSAILSYEAERRMVGRRGRVKKYEDPAKQQGQLLQFAKSKRSTHRPMWLLLPCLTLADRAHPLEAPEGQDRRKWTRKQVGSLLRKLPNPRKGEIDRRWEWATPVLLDPGLRDFLPAWRNEMSGSRESKGIPIPNPESLDSHEALDTYLDELLDLDVSGLGRRPPGLAELITEVALGSPAILASRCLKTSGIDDNVRRRLATRIAHAFWSLFNQPAVISLLRQLPMEAGASHDDTAYWRRVLRYCRQGNLQAVLDEQWHLLWEQHAWSNEASAGDVATQCTQALVDAIPPSRSRVHARFFRSPSNAVETEEIRIRTIFALRFGHLPAENDSQISQDTVRAAFNSPFRPFVLTSTSIGQEGLDFHPWCHRLVHWDLPGNPVDMEQREGRVHRYKGHAVRRNVASAHGQQALSDWSPGEDIWQRMFAHADDAARGAAESDLVPHWIASGDCRVQRHVPLLPYTREVEAFQRLKRQLAAYRVVFGQPRQEEMVTLLDQAGLDMAQLGGWAIDLTPPCVTNSSSRRGDSS